MFRFAPTFSQEDLAEDINGGFIFFVFFTILSLLD